MKRKIRTAYTTAVSIGLRNFAQHLLLDYPQGNPLIVDDLMSIANLSSNSYSVEVIVNEHESDDEEAPHE